MNDKLLNELKTDAEKLIAKKGSIEIAHLMASLYLIKALQKNEIYQMLLIISGFLLFLATILQFFK